MTGRTTSTGSTQRNLLIGCLVVALVVVGGCVVGLAVGWRSFLKFGIASDLDEFHELVKGSDLDAGKKDQLMGRLRALKARAREEPIGLLRWIDYDEDVRGILEDHKVPPDELERLEDQLSQMEEEFGVPVNGVAPGTAAPAKPATATEGPADEVPGSG